MVSLPPSSASISRHQLNALRAYLQKQGAQANVSLSPVHPDLDVVVVIPCYDEPDVTPVLQSLHDCGRPRGAVEILLVVNASERDDDALRRRNQSTMDLVDSWWADNVEPRFRVRALNFPRLPARHAGVGLARKIGMDIAVARFLNAANPGGIIASLDADCTCDNDYLTSLESHFQHNPESCACTVYFEHVLSGPLDNELYREVTRYELFLRYYRQGLRFAAFPYAHYSVGSCLAVRCHAYARHGGMNRRKAGEDFYFLNKLAAVGGVSENNATRVMPGVRASTRTPFGTGRALGKRLTKTDQTWLTYDAEVFRELAALVEDVDGYYAIAPGEWRRPTSLPDCMQAFLTANDIHGRHAEIRANCASLESFRKRFFQWFDGFRALKFIHYATRRAYPRQPLERACATLLGWQAIPVPEELRASDLLHLLRAQDRAGGASLTVNRCPLDSQPA